MLNESRFTVKLMLGDKSHLQNKFKNKMYEVSNNVYMYSSQMMMFRASNKSAKILDICMCTYKFIIDVILVARNCYSIYLHF